MRSASTSGRRVRTSDLAGAESSSMVKCYADGLALSSWFRQGHRAHNGRPHELRNAADWMHGERGLVAGQLRREAPEEESPVPARCESAARADGVQRPHPQRGVPECASARADLVVRAGICQGWNSRRGKRAVARVADSGPFRSAIPDESDHPFRRNPISRSGGFRSPY